MRVKLKDDYINREEVRITPAHAGKTLFLKTGIAFVEDHPRACG